MMLEHDQLANKFTQRFTSVLSLAAAAVMVLSIVPMVTTYHMASVEQGKNDFPLVSLSAFSVTRNGGLRSINGSVSPGATVVFKVDMPRPYAVALVMSKANGKPELRYRAGFLQSGTGQLVQTDGRLYSYQLERDDNRVTFCAIAAESERKLSQKIRLLGRIWANLPSASCVQLGTYNISV